MARYHYETYGYAQKDVNKGVKTYQPEIPLPDSVLDWLDLHYREHDEEDVGFWKSLSTLIDLSVLTDRQREVIILIYYEGKSQKETAEKLGIRQNAIFWHKDKALKRLGVIILFNIVGLHHFSQLERIVIKRYFYESETQKKIANEIGYSRGWISSYILPKIKKKLQELTNCI